MRLSDRLQGLCAQSWTKTGLGKKPYNARKYGITVGGAIGIYKYIDKGAQSVAGTYPKLEQIVIGKRWLVQRHLSSDHPPSHPSTVLVYSYMSPGWMNRKQGHLCEGPCMGDCPYRPKR